MNTPIQATIRQLRSKNVVAVQFPNTAELNKRFRQLPGARWSPTLKSWTLPDTAAYRKRFGLQEKPPVGKEVVAQTAEANRPAFASMEQQLILQNYSLSNRKLAWLSLPSYSRCVQSLPYTETLRNSRLCLDNRITKSLLTNQFINLGPSSIAEFTNNCNWEIFEKLCFERISPLIFDGLFAELVSQGGLFFRSDKSSTDIVNLARAFSYSFIEGRFADFTIYQVTGGWSLYFGKMGYDNTFILFDKLKGEIWILAKTDYD